MRTSVISRSVALAAATLGLAVALPLSLGSTAAFACGEDTAPTAPTQAPEHHDKPAQANFIPEVPGTPMTVTAGGPGFELGVEMANFTGAPYRHIAPAFNVFASADAGDGKHLINLQPADVKVEVMNAGHWLPLTMHHGCDPTLIGDTTPIQAPLADGHARRFMFRISIAADTSKKLTKLDVFTYADGLAKIDRQTLTIAHPAATAKPVPPKPVTPKPTPTATTPAPTTPAPVASNTPATVPAAVVTSTTPSAPAAPVTPATAPVAAELASTGPSGTITALAGAGGALVLLGGGALFAFRRRTAR
ncbi:hypothetical protein CFP65_3705 [Kitasatospora sp. MMS16-BH015]|uniref:LPXTG cell wall anchor domain-containing protein n=1 Tax=Kitasatospora sp. MMS16-BH015 TaxID=2018025 RepID=UPI000CA18B99|nr:LPXTG cell wall anchor domain-containing protein [Kitasatospora sp. MMS16-BH015]AUG78491.1 hypothetical protein CFP65_3705 [Kitasatospora sp. MMS16-BH015]